jgi:hypothetical protein
LQNSPDLRISIIGGGSGARRVRRSAAAVNRRCGRHVIDVRGFTLDPLSELEQASIVVGGGYTCLEAVYNGRPAIGAGFGWYGPVDRDGLSDAYNAHFGDRYCEPCGASLVAVTVLEIIEALADDSEHPDIIGHKGWFELDHDPGAHARRMEALVAELSE